MYMTLTPEQETGVIRTMEQYAMGYVNKDLKTLSAIFSPDITGFGSGPDEIITNHQTFMEHIQRDVTQATILAVDFSDRRIFGEGTVAWVTSQTTMTFTTDGATRQMIQGRSTMVLRTVEKGYRIEQLHFSLPYSEQAEGQSFPGKNS